MQPIPDKLNQQLHKKLPIDDDEKILAVFRHHWFSYFSIWSISAFLIFIIAAVTAFLLSSSDTSSSLASYRPVIIIGVVVFVIFILIGTYIPIYLRSQEQVVLTEEALLQVLQPSLFASKIDQLGLMHVADVSVRQDFFGTLFGYGHITVETPGEQDNYEFSFLPKPHETARQIVHAHENLEAAMQAGRMPTTLGTAPAPQQPMQIDPAQYQQFLQYQQMLQQQQVQAPQQQPGPGPSADDESNNPTQ